jgi:hypothetical protein
MLPTFSSDVYGIKRIFRDSSEELIVGLESRPINSTIWAVYFLRGWKNNHQHTRDSESFLWARTAALPAQQLYWDRHGYSFFFPLRWAGEGPVLVSLVAELARPSAGRPALLLLCAARLPPKAIAPPLWHAPAWRWIIFRCLLLFKEDFILLRSLLR